MVMIGSLAYFGFWRQGCVCPIGAIQNVTLAIFDRTYAMPIVALAFFLAPLVFALFLGRTFCAAVCPLGAIQDVVLVRPSTVPVWLEHALRSLAYLYLGAAVLFAATGSAFIICQYDPFVSFFRIAGSDNMLVLGTCFLVIGLFVGRPYCRFLCPYGVLLRWASLFSKWRVTITPDECVHCRLCEDACPFNAIDPPTQTSTSRNRSEGKLLLLILLVLLPIFIAIGVQLGGMTSVSLSRMHATVRLSERIALEDADKVADLTDASEAFRATGKPAEDLHRQASTLRDRFSTAARIFGGFIALIIAVKLIQLTVRQRGADYQANRSACLACGRCFLHCPVERARLKNENHQEQPQPQRSQAWQRAAVWTAIIGGVFSAAVCTVLVVNYIRGTSTDLQDTAELQQAKIELQKDAKNEILKVQIRQLDFATRQAHFHRQSISEKGNVLLLVGIIVCLIGVKFAVADRTTPPVPPPGHLENDAQARTAMFSRWAVGVAAVVICGSALLLALPSELDRPQTTSKPSAMRIEDNWPRFRGPGGLGVSPYVNVPTHWNGTTGENIIWKSPIRLPGKNSPIVWGDRVFLTAADKTTQEVYCYNAHSGKLLWRRPVQTPPGADATEVMEDTGLAPSTAATDGQRVYAIFPTGQVVCFDFDGNQRWSTYLGPLDNAYGHAASLTVYDQRVLVLLDQATADDNKSALIALDSRSGKQAWRTPRPVPNSWTTPIVINTDAGNQIITAAEPWVIAYDPKSGTELWRAESLGGEVAPSPIYANGLVLVANMGAQLAAIRPTGSGNVTKTHVAWTADEGIPDICSPLSNGELVFLLTSYTGTMTCYDADDGTKVWEKELDTPFTSSPSLVGDRIYLISEQGVAYILEAGRQYKEIGKAELGEKCYASPAFADGRIYLRSDKHLYCIGRDTP